MHVQHFGSVTAPIMPPRRVECFFLPRDGWQWNVFDLFVVVFSVADEERVDFGVILICVRPPARHSKSLSFILSTFLQPKHFFGFRVLVLHHCRS